MGDVSVWEFSHILSREEVLQDHHFTTPEMSPSRRILGQSAVTEFNSDLNLNSALNLDSSSSQENEKQRKLDQKMGKSDQKMRKLDQKMGKSDQKMRKSDEKIRKFGERRDADANNSLSSAAIESKITERGDKLSESQKQSKIYTENTNDDDTKTADTYDKFQTDEDAFDRTKFAGEDDKIDSDTDSSTDSIDRLIERAGNHPTHTKIDEGLDKLSHSKIDRGRDQLISSKVADGSDKSSYSKIDEGRDKKPSIHHLAHNTAEVIADTIVTNSAETRDQISSDSNDDDDLNVPTTSIIVTNFAEGRDQPPRVADHKHSHHLPRTHARVAVEAIVTKIAEGSDQIPSEEESTITTNSADHDFKLSSSQERMEDKRTIALLKQLLQVEMI